MFWNLKKKSKPLEFRIGLNMSSLLFFHIIFEFVLVHKKIQDFSDNLKCPWVNQSQIIDVFLVRALDYFNSCWSFFLVNIVDYFNFYPCPKTNIEDQNILEVSWIKCNDIIFCRTLLFCCCEYKNDNFSSLLCCKVFANYKLLGEKLRSNTSIWFSTLIFQWCFPLKSKSNFYNLLCKILDINNKLWLW